MQLACLSSHRQLQFDSPNRASSFTAGLYSSSPAAVPHCQQLAHSTQRHQPNPKLSNVVSHSHLCLAWNRNGASQALSAGGLAVGALRLQSTTTHVPCVCLHLRRRPNFAALISAMCLSNKSTTAQYSTSAEQHVPCASTGSAISLSVAWSDESVQPSVT